MMTTEEKGALGGERTLNRLKEYAGLTAVDIGYKIKNLAACAPSFSRYARARTSYQERMSRRRPSLRRLMSSWYIRSRRNHKLSTLPLNWLHYALYGMLTVSFISYSVWK